MNIYSVQHFQITWHTQGQILSWASWSHASLHRLRILHNLYLCSSAANGCDVESPRTTGDSSRSVCPTAAGAGHKHCWQPGPLAHRTPPRVPNLWADLLIPFLFALGEWQSLMGIIRPRESGSTLEVKPDLPRCSRGLCLRGKEAQYCSAPPAPTHFYLPRWKWSQLINRLIYSLKLILWSN